jgi:hypothetical protein
MSPLPDSPPLITVPEAVLKTALQPGVTLVLDPQGHAPVSSYSLASLNPSHHASALRFLETHLDGHGHGTGKALDAAERKVLAQKIIADHSHKKCEGRWGCVILWGADVYAFATLDEADHGAEHEHAGKAALCYGQAERCAVIDIYPVDASAARSGRSPTDGPALAEFAVWAILHACFAHLRRQEQGRLHRVRHGSKSNPDAGHAEVG